MDRASSHSGRRTMLTKPTERGIHARVIQQIATAAWQQLNDTLMCRHIYYATQLKYSDSESLVKGVTMRIKLLTANILASFLLAAAAQATPVKSPNSSGGCESNYFLVVDVCVANDALGTYTKDELMQLIYEHKGLSGSVTTRSSSSSANRICQSKVSENEDNYFELRDGSVLKKTGYGYVGYIGYAKNSLLIMKSRSSGKLMIEGKSPFNVEILRAPRRCSSPSTYPIEMAYNDEKFIINREMFEAQSYCMGWDVGDTVIFLDGSEYGACASAELYNVEREEKCPVWC